MGDDLDDEGPGGKKGGGKKVILILMLLVFLLLGGAAAAYFTGLLQPVLDLLLGPGESAADMTELEEGALEPVGVSFVDLPEMLVNMSAGRRKSFLKIRVSLELAREEDLAYVESLMPRIIDNFQIYLRELRPEDLQGQDGIHNLREELLNRVNLAARPARIRDVLFKEMLVQ